MINHLLPGFGDVTLGKHLCTCRGAHDQTPQVIAVTGGPGAGKTAVLEIARQVFCHHVAFLPEAATIVFSGGFWRRESVVGRESAQRAIFHVQRELETIFTGDRLAPIALSDRGTIDGVAYWPGDPASYWRSVGVNEQDELARYAAVIHLRTPKADGGYNHQNPMRTETAQEAARLDDLILKAWEGHPRRIVIPAEESFATKSRTALEGIRRHFPRCCDASMQGDDELSYTDPAAS